MNESPTASLRALARLCGLQIKYRDAFGRERRATPEALVATLQALGCPIGRPSDAWEALRAARMRLLDRICEPVVVAWEGRPARMELRLPPGDSEKTVSCELKCENGEAFRWSLRPAGLPVIRNDAAGSMRALVKWAPLPGRLPPGYHQLRLETGGKALESLIICAPSRCHEGGGAAGPGAWGVFLPLYALSSRRSWGSGSFTDLRRLVGWSGRLGGRVVGTLPLLGAFLDEGFEPSPYAPVSRLFWNEFYIDLEGLPELPGRGKAGGGAKLRRAIEGLREARLVDYRRGMACRRQVLEPLAAGFPENAGTRRLRAFRRFVEENPRVEDYARFRAVCERREQPWPRWPTRLRDGLLRAGDYEPRAFQYHLYVQWLASEQLGAVSRAARRRGSGLYLDFPLGVNATGYDVWRERRAFAREARAGAPPDQLFTGGQDWGFPPLHPEAIREDGYRYHIACLRRHLRHASFLRIDHVMGMHRLFWIPRGFDASHGIYVRYREEELYAILSLESHRARCVIVGENLGTVPPEVNKAMSRHRIQKLFVLQYELPSLTKRNLGAIPSGCVASLNTHDMPPFTAFWEDLDIDERVRLGMVTAASAEEEKKERGAMRRRLVAVLERRKLFKGKSRKTADVLRACLALLAASRAGLVMVNLEDLWGETVAQNVPGTSTERPNWRLKARHPLEAFRTMSAVLESLGRVKRSRKRKDSRR
jgi:4-alpha-glucanotransferase